MAKKRIKTQSITYKISLEELHLLLIKIKDLTKLDNTIIMNFSNTEILLFSIVGKNLDNVHSFKSHKIPINEIFKSNKMELQNDIRYILSDGKRFATSISVFYKYMVTQKIEDDLEFKLFYNELFCEKLLIKNSKSKEETPGGKPNNDTHRLNVDDIDDVMDTDISDFSFDLSKEDYIYIKAKLGIEKDNDILYLNINNNKLSIGENRWDHNICEIEQDDMTISFPKKYFKCINYENEENMKIYVTDTMLLVIGDTTNLLITTELYV
jgi:hypothetical protein